MKQTNNRVLAILVSVVLSISSFISCVQVDYSIGSDYAPADQELYIKRALIDLPVGQKMADSLQSASYQMAFGAIKDPELGITTVDLAFTITPRDTLYNLIGLKDKEVTGAFLYCYLNEAQTFEENQERIFQHFNVYQLDMVLDSSTVYCNSIKEQDYSRNIAKGATVYSGADTLIIRLDNDFAAQYLTGTEVQFDSLSLYAATHSPIYIKADEPTLAEAGGRLNMFGSIEMYVDFKFKDTINNVFRDTTAIFDGGASSGYSIQTYRHSSYSLEVSDKNNQETLLYEGLAGIKPYISSKTLKGILDNWADGLGVDPKNIMISRASLILPYEDPENIDEMDEYPQSLFPCTRSLNSKNVLQYSPLVTIYDDTFSRGNINTSLNYYKPDITMLAQDLLLAREEYVTDDQDIWLITPFEYVVETGGGSASSYMDAYSLYDPYSMGYGYTGANMYNSSYYSYMLSSMFASQSSSQTYYYADYMNYFIGKINGNGAVRRPQLEITYAIMQESK